jgi:hypothetical protein|tara:strand:+ start:110 stop:292 length:183 start_codon:yes stop_codon:yes gene_type:complete
MPDPPPTKDKIRQQLESDVTAFLNKGGKIDRIGPGETNWKQTRYGAVDVAKNPKNEQGKS